MNTTEPNPPARNYFLDTEFIEDGKTIDLISIALVCDDGRELYLQNAECNFANASDFVWRNVFPSLKDFDMRGTRSCNQQKMTSCSDKLTGKCYNTLECPWRLRFEIRDEVREFCNPEKYGKPVFWGYFADYDWVAFCQLFGTMMHLPKDFPMFCNDIKQLCNSRGNPSLPEQGKGEHNALADAKWNKQAYYFLQTK